MRRVEIHAVINRDIREHSEAQSTINGKQVEQVSQEFEYHGTYQQNTNQTPFSREIIEKHNKKLLRNHPKSLEKSFKKSRYIISWTKATPRYATKETEQMRRLEKDISFLCDATKSNDICHK